MEGNQQSSQAMLDEGAAGVAALGKIFCASVSHTGKADGAVIALLHAS